MINRNQYQKESTVLSQVNQNMQGAESPQFDSKDKEEVVSVVVHSIDMETKENQQVDGGSKSVEDEAHSYLERYAVQQMHFDSAKGSEEEEEIS